MHVHIAKAQAHQSMALDEMKDFLVLCLCSCGKRLEQRKYLFPVLEAATGQFANNEGVAGNLSVFQETFKSGIAESKMRNPD